MDLDMPPVKVRINYLYFIKVNEVNPGPILLCGAHTVVLCCDEDFNWLGRVWGGGGIGI
jgi:hypothetical protein